MVFDFNHCHLLLKVCNLLLKVWWTGYLLSLMWFKWAPCGWKNSEVMIWCQSALYNTTHSMFSIKKDKKKKKRRHQSLMLICKRWTAIGPRILNMTCLVQHQRQPHQAKLRIEDKSGLSISIGIWCGPTTKPQRQAWRHPRQEGPTVHNLAPTDSRYTPRYGSKGEHAEKKHQSKEVAIGHWTSRDQSQCHQAHPTTNATAREC